MVIYIISINILRESLDIANNNLTGVTVAIYFISNINIRVINYKQYQSPILKIVQDTN